MPTFAEFMKNPDIKIPVADGTNRNRNPRCRRYDLIAYRFDASHRINRSKKPEIISNIPSNKVKELRAALRKDGCYRVDVIEVTTKFRNNENKLETLTFDGEHDTPTKVIPVPTPNEIPNPIRQSTLPWDVVQNTTPAYLPEYSNKRLDLRKEHDKAERLRSHINRSTETKSSNVRIYEKAGNKLVYAGNEEGAVFFIMNNPVDLAKYVYYINDQVFHQL